MADKHYGKPIKITLDNVTQIHKRITNFVKNGNRQWEYSAWHNFDTGFDLFEPFCKKRFDNTPAKVVELHFAASKEARSKNDFIRACFDVTHPIAMLHVGDEVLFTRDSFTVKSDWHKFWGATPPDDPKKHIYKRVERKRRK